MRSAAVIIALCLRGVVARGFWADVPASPQDVIRTAYPIGNGKLGVMPYGDPGEEVLNLNLDSLWSGGPFESESYNGGNPTDNVYDALSGIRDFIFQNGTGNLTGLQGNSNDYGSYQVLGNLSISIAGVNGFTRYNRSLDFQTGLHITKFSTNHSSFVSTIYCSFPDQVCVYSLSSSHALPEIRIKLDNELVDSFLKNITCGTDHLRLSGLTQLGPPTGMRYESIARLLSGTDTFSQCDNSTNALIILPQPSRSTISLVFGAGTDYLQSAGNPSSNFTFRGSDPLPLVTSTTSQAASKVESQLRRSATSDHSFFFSQFTLSVPSSPTASDPPTASLIAAYLPDGGTPNPSLEATLFDFGRHLFISSSRPDSLPPNLQGRWATDLSNAWSADYHANINLQMNHWGAAETGLGELMGSFWDYMQETWVPRGELTAQLLYGADKEKGAWVVHDEMNIFGHTGMKLDDPTYAQWAAYPAASAWMMQHVYDWWEYGQDIIWLTEQGFELMRGVAEFWLEQLQEDEFFKDGTLVVNPCNSPEHGPTTFGCTHYQQLLHQLFTIVLATSTQLASFPPFGLTTRLTTALSRLDTGLHIGSFGEVKEWKLPDTYGYDFPNDTHRHLSQLVGWYPGWSLSSYAGGVGNKTVKDAVRASLENRGKGEGADADAGWEKVWRGACWARLGEAESAYGELSFAIGENFAGNGLSMYSGRNPPFQIDANFGIVGNTLGMLVTDLPQDIHDNSTHKVVLGPAIPSAWCPGSVDGLRLRGGGQVKFSWDEQGLVTEAHVSGRTKGLRVVDKYGKPVTSA